MEVQHPVEYKTVLQKKRSDLKVRGSRFIASAFPVSSKEELEKEIRNARKEFHDATHSPYAFRLGAGGDRFKSSDDGEPAGTAGRPILAMIDKYKLTNVLVVVTRYFGGTKLGRGGLARAYSLAAENALGQSEIVTVPVEEELTLTFPYTEVAGVMQLLSSVRARILDADYSEEVRLRIGIPMQNLPKFKENVIQVTKGNIDLG